MLSCIEKPVQAPRVSKLGFIFYGYGMDYDVAFRLENVETQKK